MQRILRNLALCLLVAGAIWWLWPEPPLRHPPGVRVTKLPAQAMIPPRDLGERRGYHLTAVAAYEIEARVLRTKRYLAQGEDLVPIDVALGWGVMSDQAILDRLKISQSNRFFFYEWQNEPPCPPGELISTGANVHVIAADKAVAKAVRRLRAGQFVKMRGYLVNATKPNGFQWKSSLLRTDTGNGACELFYVEAITPTNTLVADS